MLALVVQTPISAAGILHNYLSSLLICILGSSLLFGYILKHFFLQKLLTIHEIHVKLTFLGFLCSFFGYCKLIHTHSHAIIAILNLTIRFLQWENHLGGKHVVSMSFESCNMFVKHPVYVILHVHESNRSACRFWSIGLSVVAATLTMPISLACTAFTFSMFVCFSFGKPFTWHQ